MTDLDTETYVLGAELDRLDDRLDDLVADLDDAEAGSPTAQVLQQAANEVDQRGEGVAHLVDEYDADAEVTVRGLTAGDYARVEDLAATFQAQKDGPGGVPGSRRNAFAAAGLLDAPFLNGDADDLEDRLPVLARQPLGVVKWIEGRVNHHTTRGDGAGNWRSLDDRLVDRADATGTD